MSAPRCCPGCLTAGVRLRLLVLPDGRRVEVCQSCRQALASMYGPPQGTRRKPVKAQLLEPASDDDKAWFATRHGRSHRIRSPIGGEALALPVMPGSIHLVAVHQVRPGVRVKATLSWPEDEPIPLNSEAAARALYETICGPNATKIEEALA